MPLRAWPAAKGERDPSQRVKGAGRAGHGLCPRSALQPVGAVVTGLAFLAPFIVLQALSIGVSARWAGVDLAGGLASQAEVSSGTWLSCGRTRRAEGPWLAGHTLCDIGSAWVGVEGPGRARKLGFVLCPQRTVVAWRARQRFRRADCVAVKAGRTRFAGVRFAAAFVRVESARHTRNRLTLTAVTTGGALQLPRGQSGEAISPRNTREACDFSCNKKEGNCSHSRRKMYGDLSCVGIRTQNDYKISKVRTKVDTCLEGCTR